jgi:hypothetical protein
LPIARLSATRLLVISLSCIKMVQFFFSSTFSSELVETGGLDEDLPPAILRLHENVLTIGWLERDTGSHPRTCLRFWYVSVRVSAVLK